jgi:hypothetical protein
VLACGPSSVVAALDSAARGNHTVGGQISSNNDDAGNPRSIAVKSVMSSQSITYGKITFVACAVFLLAAGAELSALIIGWTMARLAIGIVAGIVCVAALLIIAASVVVIIRQRLLEQRRPDLFLTLNASRAEARVLAASGFRAGPLRRASARVLLGHDFLVGDEVEVRSLDEIRSTLDPAGCLEALPFMREMEKTCGRTLRVIRIVDKIYDYNRTRSMRRLDRCVLLSGLRCDGNDHGGCQAACYLLWRVEWLRHRDERGRPSNIAPTAPVAPSTVNASALPLRFVCQFTQLHAASKPLWTGDVFQDLRPLVAGNVTLLAFATAMLTRLFNTVQALHGGLVFPVVHIPATAMEGPVETLAVGDVVEVRSSAEIGATLGRRGKHRGLWFDKEMIKYCHQRYRVAARVDRLIVVESGEMRHMKTPCLVLDGVDASGEYMRFGAQHDHLFWREVWLKKTAPEEAQRPP